MNFAARIWGLARKPTAFMPLGMSLAASALVAGVLAIYGSAAKEPDEGTAAHVWQLLMVGQVPFLAMFALKWLPREHSAALVLLAVNLSAALGAVALVWCLGL